MAIQSLVSRMIPCTSSLQQEAHGETFMAGKEYTSNKQTRTTAGGKGPLPPPRGSTPIPGLWPPPDRSVFRVWVPVYFVSGGTFHAAYLLRGCGVSTPHFGIFVAV